MKRFYVVPKTGTGLDPDNAFRPKYLADAGVPYSSLDYGLEDTFLVGGDVTDDQHILLASQIDVIAIPSDLDGLIGLSALSTVQARLNGLHIPADWVTTSHTYRDVIRLTGKLFLFMQRFHGRQLRRFFEGGITLDTRVNELTQVQKSAMIDVAESFGFDTSVVTNPMTLRQALRLIAEQMPPFILFGETF